MKMREPGAFAREVSGLKGLIDGLADLYTFAHAVGHGSNRGDGTGHVSLHEVDPTFGVVSDQRKARLREELDRIDDAVDQVVKGLEYPVEALRRARDLRARAGRR